MGKNDKVRTMTETKLRWFKSRGVWTICRVCNIDLVVGDEYHYQQSSTTFRHLACAKRVNVI